MFGKEENLYGGDDNDGCSDFKENCEDIRQYNGSNSDKEEVYIGKGTLGKPFAHELDGKLKLELGHLFGDVHKFKAIIKDSFIQEGFAISRVKNGRSQRYI